MNTSRDVANIHPETVYTPGLLGLGLGRRGQRGRRAPARSASARPLPPSTILTDLVRAVTRLLSSELTLLLVRYCTSISRDIQELFNHSRDIILYTVLLLYMQLLIHCINKIKT